MNTKRIGNIGEAAVLAKLVELGCPVYIPFGDDEKSDLIAEFNGCLNRIQIKTTDTIEDGYYTIDFRNCKNHVCCPQANQLYSKNDIDYFITYCIPRKTICIFKTDEMPHAAIRLRFESSKNGQVKGVRFEKDYLIDNFFN